MNIEKNLAKHFVSLPHKSMRGSYVFLLLIPLFLLPLLGTWLSGMSILPFLTFPPRPAHVNPGEVSWVLFSSGALCIALTIRPFFLRLLMFPHQSCAVKTHHPFPIWGWMAFTCLILFWIVAWNRFTWLESFQLHTFTPLWLSYIVIVNALTSMRTGHCFLMDKPRLFFSLFPLSAAFWWMFEYFNRFVQNWYYLPNAEFNALTYFFLGSLSFSTVLPAVYGTYELLCSVQRINDPFKAWWTLSTKNVRGIGWALLLSACIGLIGIGFIPKFLYPLIWVSPLLILLGIQILQGQETILEKLQQGDWRWVVTSALAGLICGFFWELWNSQSLAHWEYTIPYLHTFQIFEMPILGYAGYLPFGLECLMFTQFILFRLEAERTMAPSNH